MRTYMKKALDEARKAVARGEVPVGAVIVRDGAVIAAAGNECVERRDSCAHAEILVIRAAMELLGTGRLTGCELYVTLEPCPMCAGAAVTSGISKVVYGAADTEYGALGSVLNLASGTYGAGMEVYGGIMESECAGILKEFFTVLRQK